MSWRTWAIGLLVVIVVTGALVGGYMLLRGPGVSPGDPDHFRVGDVEFTMRYAPGVTFPMGVEDDGVATVEHDFWIGETVVTYELWYEVKTWAEEHGYRFSHNGREGSHGEYGEEPSEDRHQPVTRVNAHSAYAWCNALSEYLGFTPVYLHDAEVYRDASDRDAGNDISMRKVLGFRLPTSDEWELAARYRGRDRRDGAIACPAGRRTYWTPGTYASGARGPYTDEEATHAVAWTRDNTDRSTQVVGQKPAGGNHLNLYDMSGNVFEWVYCVREDAPNARGGSYYRGAGDTLMIGDPSPRGQPDAHRSFSNVGIRLVLSLEIDPEDAVAVREDEEEEGVDEAEEEGEEEEVPFPAGSLVEAEWEGQWYPARVVDVDGDRCLISYDDSDREWDEWVDLSRIRDRQTDLVVTSVEEVAIVVDHGTELADVDFPGDLEAGLPDGSIFQADVQWGSAPYDGHEEGEYFFWGELTDLPPNVTNPDDVRAAATIRVRDPEGSTARLRMGGDTDVEGLLWYVEHDDGHHGYYFGTSSQINLTHVVVEDDSGDFYGMIIFERDLYPIQWIFEELTISIVMPGDDRFDASEAVHVFAYEEEQVHVTLNIEMDMNVDVVLDRMPDVFSSELSSSIETLRETLQDMGWSSLTVEEAVLQADAAHETSIAAALSIAGVGMSILDLLESIVDETATDDAGVQFASLLPTDEQTTAMMTLSAFREIRQRMAGRLFEAGKFRMGGTLVQMLSYLERIASGEYDGHDIEGPAVNMLLCRGASSVPKVCNEFYFPNTGENLSRCVSMCHVTLACFTDICHPMMFSVGDALNLRQP